MIMEAKMQLKLNSYFLLPLLVGGFSLCQSMEVDQEEASELLRDAITKKNIPEAISLINEVKNLNIVGVTNNPLYWAAVIDSPILVKELIDHGANPNFIYSPPIEQSALSVVKSPQVLKVFLDNGADINLGRIVFHNVNERTYLVAIILNARIPENQKIEMIKLLTDHNVDVNQPSYFTSARHATL